MFETLEMNKNFIKKIMFYLFKAFYNNCELKKNQKQVNTRLKIANAQRT